MADDDRALYIISVAAELAGVHPQTLRIYERKGLHRAGAHRAAAAAATPTATSRCCGGSRSSPTRASASPACSGSSTLEDELARRARARSPSSRRALDASATARSTTRVEAGAPSVPARAASRSARAHRSLRSRNQLTVDVVDSEHEPEVTRMPLDPEQVHPQDQEALGAAQAARPGRATTPRSRPSTCSRALLGQPEGVVLPRARADRRRRRRGRATGSTRRSAQPARRSTGATVQRRAARRPTRSACSRRPTSERVELDDEYLSTEHLLLAMTDVTGGVGDLLRGRSASRTTPCSTRCKQVRGSHRVTSENPEEQYQALEKYGRDLTEDAAQGQARSGHRPRRGDPPRHPGAVAPHEEQPGAHRRARRRQDRDRRGPRPPHRRGRRARGSAQQAR